MKKRIIYILLIAGLLMAALLSATACTDANNTTHQDVPSDTLNDTPSDTYGDTPLSGTLTVSQCWNYYNLGYAIEKFNKIYPGVEIILTTYNSDAEKYRAQVSAQLISGTAGDILDAGVFSYMELADRGFLADFYPLMRQDAGFNKDDYYMNVFKGLEYKGKLYSFPVYFYYSLIGVNNVFSEDLAGRFKQYCEISTREMLDLYQGLNDRGNHYIDRNFDAIIAIRDNYGDFVDHENKTCWFNTDEFTKLLEDAKGATHPLRFENRELGWYMGSDFTRASQEEAAHQYLFWKASCSRYEVLFPIVEKNVFSHFIPMVNNNGNLVFDPSKQFYISEASKNKELAWEFLKFLTTPDMIQESDLFVQFPVNRMAFAAHANPYISSVVDDWRKNFEAIDGETADVVSEIIAVLEQYNNMPMEATKYAYGEGLSNIIDDIVQNFYNNVLTAEQAASELQNKVSLYLR